MNINFSMLPVTGFRLMSRTIKDVLKRNTSRKAFAPSSVIPQNCMSTANEKSFN